MHLCPALNPSRSLSLSLAVLCSKEWIPLLLLLLLLLQMRTPRALYAPSYLPKRIQAGKASFFSLWPIPPMQDRNNRPPPSYRNSKAKKEDPQGTEREREREREREKSRAAKTTLRVQKRIQSYQSKTKRNNSANKQTNNIEYIHTYLCFWFVT